MSFALKYPEGCFITISKYLLVQCKNSIRCLLKKRAVPALIHFDPIFSLLIKCDVMTNSHRPGDTSLLFDRKSVYPNPLFIADRSFGFQSEVIRPSGGEQIVGGIEQ